MDIKAQSLFKEMQAMAAESVGKPPNANMMPNAINPSSANFAEMLGDAINNVNNMTHESIAKTKRFELGDKSLSLADVMVAKEKSSIAFEATVQVRNKVLEAYKQIMNMPV